MYSSDVLSPIIYVDWIHGHFHCPGGASSFNGSDAFQSTILRANDNSASAFNNQT